MQNNKYIASTHLLNNYTGSPFVLSQVIEVWEKNNIPVRLFIGNRKGEGFLSSLPVKKHYSFYRFCENKGLRLFYVFAAEVHLFFKILFKVNQKDCRLIYANTLYSFGAAVTGKLKGIPVIYHIHETSLKPPLLKRFLVSVVRLCSTRNVFVSRTHREQEKVNGIVDEVVYNCLESKFFEKAIASSYFSRDIFNVLMVCSLKAYKGINEFVEIAKKLEAKTTIQFTLVLNANKFEIQEYFKETAIPTNITFLESQKDLIPFYKKASLVINLSRPDQWIETFGLTLLEAITFGIPVIAPPVGGPTELVDDGINGYLLSCYETETIANKIVELCENPELCLQLSAKAREKALQFSPELFERNILELINEY